MKKKTLKMEICRFMSTQPKLTKLIFRGGIGSLVIKMINMLASFLFTIILARSLGKEGFGQYSFAFALIMLVSMPVQFGLPTLLVRETAKYQAIEKWAKIRGLWSWSRIIVALFSIVAVAITVIIIYFRQGGFSSSHVVLIGLAIVPLKAYSNIFSSCLRGLRHIVISLVPDNVIRPLLLLVTVFIIYKNEQLLLTAEIAMFVYVLVAIITLLPSLYFMLKLRPSELILETQNEYECFVWLNAVIPLALINGFYLLNNYIDILVIGYFHEDSTVGVYKAAAQLSVLVSFGLQSINRVLHPFFSRLYNLNQFAKLQEIVATSSMVIIAIGVLPLILLISYGETFLALCFGETFSEGAIALSVLCIGQSFNMIMGSAGALLNMTGHERYTMIGVGVSALINIVLNILLVPSFGIIGAASATAVSMVVWNIVLHYYVKKLLNIESCGLIYFFVKIWR